MAPSPRRSISSFSLSFLDIMFCGFGAVVLLVLIINTNIISARHETLEDRRSELLQQELLLKLSRQHLDELQKDYTQLQEENASLDDQLENLASDINTLTASLTSSQRIKKNKGTIAELEKELKSLEKELTLLKAQKKQEREIGRKVRRFEGTGNRQYLTGLKLGGSRVLILIDTSASMLDRKIVDIIRRKVRGAEDRRAAPKWQRAIATVEWLMANLPQTSSVRLYGFNTAITPFTPQEKEEWIKITDTSQIDTVLQKLQSTAPLNGTNLEVMFRKVRDISPRPDNIILITDGLPTQGKGGSRSRIISGEDRVELYEKALDYLPKSIPVNIILFPIEGDPLASVLFWKLAIDTGGSFFTPTRDWP